MTSQIDSDGFQQVKSKRGPGPRGQRKQQQGASQLREQGERRQQNERREGQTENQDRRRDTETEAPRERLSFKDLLFERNNLKKHEHSPKVDLWEEKDDKGNYYVIRMEIPGIHKNDITITVRDQQFVLVSAFKKGDKPDTESIIYSECKFGKIMRRVKVPNLIYEDQVYTKYDQGVLKIELVQIPVEEQENELDSRLDDEQTEIETTMTPQVLYSTLVKTEQTEQNKQTEQEIKTIDFKDLSLSTGNWADEPVEMEGKSWADM